jgi:serine/threonine-protein kinase
MIGTQLGAYLLKTLLGSGGMGRVYLAEHVDMHDLWAVKVLSDELNHRPDIVVRFVNEARAAAKVRHRNLIRVVHVGQTPSGLWYMVLEYLEGGTLAGFMASQGARMPYGMILRLLCQVANALHELHKHKIIHRDVKADNIFLITRSNERGVDDHFPILLDLGVASVGEGLSTGAQTQRGAILGTSCSMAPEQLLGERVGPEADVYALGVLLYEMSTGWLPYQADGESRAYYMQLAPAEIYRRQMAGPPVDPRLRNPGLSDAYAKVVYHWLEVRRENRTSTMKDAVYELAEATPVDETGQGGFQIVDKYARELVQSDDQRETMRSPVAVVSASGTETRIVFGEKLGSGGMAEVFAGTLIGEHGIGRPVALKRVLPDLSAQPGFEAMLITEARITTRMVHPNIVTVLHLQKDPDNRLCVVMEYVDGKDLYGLLAAGPLPYSTTTFIIVEVLRGLAYAHDLLDPVTGTRGIIHRDISPENILLGNAGEVKVNDFGLARAFDAAGRVGSSTIRGKPSYMSPEQVRGQLLDARSDLWAVGVMLWEMLARRPMLTGSQTEVMANVLHKEIPPPRSFRPEVPADLEAVAMKLLQRDLNLRYAKADAVIADLLGCEDAPLNGRDEVASHLATRFGQSDPGASRRGTAGVVVTARALAPEQRITTPVNPSTLGSAASELTPSQPLPRPRRWRQAMLWSLPVITAVAAFFVALAARRHAAEGTSVAVVGSASVQDRDAGPRPGAVPHRDVLVAAPAAPPAVVPDVVPLADAGLTADAAMPVDARTAVAVLVDAGAPAAAMAGRVSSNHPPSQPPSHRPAPPPVTAGMAEPGTLVIVVQPWATVRLNNKPAGATPFTQKLSAGKYSVRLENDELNRTETITVTIEPNKTISLERTW